MFFTSSYIYSIFPSCERDRQNILFVSMGGWRCSTEVITRNALQAACAAGATREASNSNGDYFKLGLPCFCCQSDCQHAVIQSVPNVEYTHMYVCIYIFFYMCVYACTIYMYIHVYIYIYIHRQNLAILLNGDIINNSHALSTSLFPEAVLGKSPWPRWRRRLSEKIQWWSRWDPERLQNDGCYMLIMWVKH